jgi:DNA-binding response OmpR family regulator
MSKIITDQVSNNQATNDILKPRILIVDDEDYVRSFLKDALTALPYTVQVAEDAESAIKILKESKFDLILSDINMPGMSGMDLLTFCKEKYQETEVMLITGNPDLDGAVGSIKQGAFDYLSKPILLDKLYERVEAALKHGKRKSITISTITAAIQDSGYRNLKVLGSGNEGTVYLVEKDGQHFAMKVLNRNIDNLLYDRKFERFIRETEILANMEHPNIVKMFDYGVLNKGKIPYIVMEFLSGQPLNKLIGKRNFSFEEKVKIIKDVANALLAVHEHGILHRDIKPANIILTDDNVIKLTDFGIARLKNSDLTMTRELLGSPAYMSPESFDNAKTKDIRSEIFSLGVIAYELFLGVRPFLGDSIGELIHVIKEMNPVEPKKMNPDIPEYIQSILAKMLAKHPSDRFSNMQEFLTAIDQKDKERKKISFPHKIIQMVRREKSVWR